MLTEAQQQIRQTGIGASEVGAVVGLNPWASPHDVWERKTGRAQPHEDTTATLWGRYMEPAIVALWKRQSGRKVRYANRHQRTLRHPDHPLVVATPDGLVDPGAVLEVKTYGWRVAHHWGEPGTDEIPEYYLTQVTWAMAAAQRREAIVVAACERDVDEYRVDYNPDLFQALLERVEQFWRDYVETDTPPPADHTDRCKAVLERYYPRPLAKEMAPASDEADTLAARIKDARERKADAERAEKEATHELMQHIGSNYGIKTALGKVLWYPVAGRTTVDAKALLALAKQLGATDEQIADCQRQGSDYRVFRPYFSSK